MAEYKIETLAIHAGREGSEGVWGSLVPPLDMSASFALPEYTPDLFATLLEGDPPPYIYTRWGNPTVEGLGARLAALEGAEAALVTASGMAAVSELVLTLLGAGDHIVASEVCYVGSMQLFAEHLPRFGIEVTLVDTSDLAQVEAALRPTTRLLYVETPANPVLRVSDIAALARLAHAMGIPLAVDSTFATPALQRPLALGADYVIHSLTKYLSGHGDALGGAILGTREALHRIRRGMHVHLGGAASPFNAWLVLRGLVTLPLRMERHSANALAVARFLEGHPAVERVFYPGLESHPHHAVARQQMSAFGGMVAARLKGGVAANQRLAERVRLFRYATSLGHMHSLLSCYATSTYLDPLPYLSGGQKARIREWMGDSFVRLSVGLENVGDLIADLDQALE
jgi:cystathionine beta-lyase/cystathionine gamma-synthase